jgi:asparagine synthase (glutamine-hydrolysing)
MSLDFRLKQFLRGVDAPPSLRHASWIASFLPGEIGALLQPGLRSLASPEIAFRQVLEDATRSGARPGSIDEALRYYLTRYLADDILVKADRASMAASLELRAPYLDTEVVELAARLPWQLKISLTRTKVLLKRALRGLVPDEILGRPKKGFGIPVAAWIRGPLRPLFEELLSERERSARSSRRTWTAGRTCASPSGPCSCSSFGESTTRKPSPCGAPLEAGAGHRRRWIHRIAPGPGTG